MIKKAIFCDFIRLFCIFANWFQWSTGRIFRLAYVLYIVRTRIANGFKFWPSLIAS